MLSFHSHQKAQIYEEVDNAPIFIHEELWIGLFESLRLDLKLIEAEN